VSRALTKDNIPGFPFRQPFGRMPGHVRRRQIITIAMRLFSEKGFKGTTTKEIADAAGVNQTILFRHFATKEDLYAAILDDKARTAGTEKWLAELKLLAKRKEDFALFRSVVARVLDQGRRDRDFTRLMLYSALEGHALASAFRNRNVRPVFSFLCRYITERQEDGEFRLGDPAVVVRALFGLPSYHSQVVSLFNCRLLKMNDMEAADSFTRLILDGIKLH